MSSFRSSSSSRYNSFDNRSSTQSDPSSSTIKTQSPAANVSSAIAKSKSTKNDQNFRAMVNKFMEKKPKGGVGAGRDFLVATDATSFIKGAATFGGLHKKLLGTKSKSGDRKKKPLTDVKPINARTLAMVLRSERELLSQNKEHETEITDLKLMLLDKNREVDKLKDLCLKQKEEIKALKSAILFPDVMNTQLQGLLEKKDSELKNAKQIIPDLQRQVTSLTTQLQCLAEDLAEVKADKYADGGCYDGLVGSPRTPTTYDQEEATNSLELSSGDHTTPGSPDDMFLNDLNPCLTPYVKSKFKKSAPRQMPTPQGYSTSSPYTGSGVPSSMYMGVQPYGASSFNQTSMPPYDVPVSGSSAYSYNYNNRVTGGNHRPLHLAGTPPIPVGPS